MRPYRGMTKEGKWVYGNYCNLAGLHFISEYPVGAGQNVDGKLISGWVRVLGKTVGQQVGLKDKKRTKEYPKGQEIYDGDLEDTNWDTANKRRIVWFFKHEARFIQTYISEYLQYQKDKSNEIRISNTGRSPNSGTAIVIGNITEKPELLEKNNVR